MFPLEVGPYLTASQTTSEWTDVTVQSSYAANISMSPNTGRQIPLKTETDRIKWKDGQVFLQQMYINIHIFIYFM